MSDVQKAYATQLANIEKRTGKSLKELAALLEASGAVKFGERRDFLKRELGMGHVDANTLVGYVDEQSEGAAPASASEVLDGIYAGRKAALRPIHERLMRAIDAFGPFEVAPKKGYVSLRRKKQFATIGPTTQTRVDVGLNMKGVAPGARLVAEPPGRMCDFKVALTSPEEVDANLLGWIRKAYDSAG